jgi:hypothetical protein
MHQAFFLPNVHEALVIEGETSRKIKIIEVDLIVEIIGQLSRQVQAEQA